MHMRRRPQHQATKHVVDFVDVHDKTEPRTLLIVYYAGHGSADPNSFGRISLSGRYPNNDAEQDWSINWTDVEPILGNAESDVVVIFDCCHAGLLCRPAYRGPRRSFYYVAACDADQQTYSSGDKSFTSAMIWALKKLAHTPGFTVTRLVETLMQHKPFPREKQEARVHTSRWGPGHEIWIAPSPEKRNPGAVSALPDSRPSSSAREDLLPTADILDLRFHFADHAAETHIRQTALDLKDFLETNKSLHFHRISFIDHTSFAKCIAARWIETHRRRKSARESLTSVQRPPLAHVDSEDAANSLDDRLLQLPRLDVDGGIQGSPMSTTAVASPVGSASHLCEKESLMGDPDAVKGQVLYHLGMAFGLLVERWRPVSSWHPSTSMVSL